MAQPFPFQRYLAPRYWPTWLGLGLLRAAIRLPYRTQMRLGAALGRLLYRVSRRRRDVAAINLALCFPDLTGTQRRGLLRRHFESLGMGLFETAISWWAPDRALAGLDRIEGLEHLQTALAKGRGVILLSAHFTTLEIGGRLLARHAPFHIMYRDHKNALFDALMKRARERNFERAIHRENLRGMLRSLKENRPVWYAPDQNYHQDVSIFVSFFGVPASTIVATARLARMSGAAVVPFFQHRHTDGSGYTLTLLPALADFPSADVEADTLRVNQVIEQQIRKAPEQYLWVHRRFKTRPAGLADVYTRRPRDTSATAS